MQKNVAVSAGDIFFIPLFLEHDSSLKSYSRYRFDKPSQMFSFARVIKDLHGMGILMEIFNIKGELNTNIRIIESSERLCYPVLVAGDGIQKKRWRKIGKTEDYDYKKSSNFEQIEFLIGDITHPSIWRNNQTRQPNGDEDLSSIQRAKILTAWQLEIRVIELLKDRGTH